MTKKEKQDKKIKKDNKKKGFFSGISNMFTRIREFVADRRVQFILGILLAAFAVFFCFCFCSQESNACLAKIVQAFECR